MRTAIALFHNLSSIEMLAASNHEAMVPYPITTYDVMQEMQKSMVPMHIVILPHLPRMAAANKSNESTFFLAANFIVNTVPICDNTAIITSSTSEGTNPQ